MHALVLRLCALVASTTFCHLAYGVETFRIGTLVALDKAFEPLEKSACPLKG